MKKLLLLYCCAFILSLTVQAQKSQNTQMGASGGAARLEELGQAVFSALQQNQPDALNNYLPQAGDLRLLARKSSKDMRAVLEKNSPESVRQSLNRDLAEIMQQTTGTGINLADMQLSHTKATQLDKKNRQLYRVQLTLNQKDQTERYVLFEAFKVRNRYFLFRQMLFKPAL